MRVKLVGRVPYFEDGTRACSNCMIRPARVDRSGPQRLCRVCATEDMRQRRKGKTGILVREEDRGLVLAIRRAQLSAEERELVIDTIVELRAAPAGRHHAGLSHVRIFATIRR